MTNVAIETPERLLLSYRLAGIGPRMIALMIDTLLQGTVLGVAYAVVAGGLQMGDHSFGAITMAFFYVVSFTIQWGYFTFFEVITRGRSPGKAVVRIRVVRANGEPLDAVALVVRNLLRVIDAFPLVYAVGGLVTVIDRRSRRVGDMAADTLVVHDPVLPHLDLVSTDDEGIWDVPSVKPTGVRLSDEELYTIRRFLSSVDQMPQDRRASVSATFAARVATRIGTDVPQGDPIDYLRGVYRGHAPEDEE